MGYSKINQGGTMGRFLLLFSLVSTLFFSSAGCMHYQPEYPVDKQPDNQNDISTLMIKAEVCVQNAENAEDLQQCLSEYEKIVTSDPDNYQALIALGNLYLLWGDGYVASTEEKARYFLKALHLCEQAMYSNPQYRKRVEGGESAWQASEALSEREIDALVFWATAVFYYYKECLGPLGQVINYPWIKRAESMLSQAETLNPDWQGGIIYMSWGLYYLSLPEMVGGDRNLSARYFAKALETGPNRPINYWARAKYFHVKMDNREEFLHDLQWILDHDLQNMEGDMAWKRFFILDAKRLLAKTDELFQ